MGFRSVDGLAVAAVGAVLAAIVLPVAGQTGWIGIVAKIAVGALVLVTLYGLVWQVRYDRSVRRVSRREDKTADDCNIRETSHDS